MTRSQKSRRRGSQAFQFEQSEETLLQSETLQNLYTNKNYVAPLPRKLESIQEMEEVECISSGGQETRSRREVKNKKRFIEPNQFLKVDDERNKRRKVMVQKLWKGRNKPKPIPLREEQELLLEQILDLKEATFEEDEQEDCEEKRLRKEFWKDVVPAIIVEKPKTIKEPARGKESNAKKIKKGIAVIESAPGENYSHKGDTRGGHHGQGDLGRYIDIDPRPASPNPLSHTSVDDSLASFIPADELADVLSSEDLLFCQEPRSRKQPANSKTRPEVEAVTHIDGINNVDKVFEPTKVAPVAEETSLPCSSDTVAARTRRRLKQGQLQGEAVLQDISNKGTVVAGGRGPSRGSEEKQKKAGPCGGVISSEAKQIVEKMRRSRSRDGSRRSRYCRMTLTTLLI